MTVLKAFWKADKFGVMYLFPYFLRLGGVDPEPDEYVDPL